METKQQQDDGIMYRLGKQEGILQGIADDLRSMRDENRRFQDRMGKAEQNLGINTAEIRDIRTDMEDQRKKTNQLLILITVIASGAGASIPAIAEVLLK